MRQKTKYFTCFYIMQLNFKVAKDIILNSTHYFILKIQIKRELQQIRINHSSDIDFKDSRKIYKIWTVEQYSFLVDLSVLIFACIYFRELKEIYSASIYFRKWQVFENFASTYFCKWQDFQNFEFINFCKWSDASGRAPSSLPNNGLHVWQRC